MEQTGADGEQGAEQECSASLPRDPGYRVRTTHTPNLATSAAKLVCRAGGKGCSTWPGLEPLPHRILKLF